MSEMISYKFLEVMKIILLSLLLTVCCVSSYAQKTDLRKMQPQQRDEYLVKLAKEVVLNFGSDSYGEALHCIQKEVRVSPVPYV